MSSWTVARRILELSDEIAMLDELIAPHTISQPEASAVPGDRAAKPTRTVALDATARATRSAHGHPRFLRSTC